MALPAAERLQLAGPAGAIEALVETPRDTVDAVAVVCHPHPLYGGTLDNKVVHTLARTFAELGAASVRFNFRGVGASEGVFADGLGESEDAAAVIAWARDRWRGAALWLAGFSFGGAVAIRIARAQNPAWLVTVAPAVGRVQTAPDVAPDCPWLILQGDADDIVPFAEVRDWAASHAPAADLKVLPGVGHFFHGRLHELKDLVSASAPRR